MKRIFANIFFSVSLFGATAFQPAWAVTAPDPDLTPGQLCTSQDPNFMGYYYSEHIARCNRNVGTAEKLKVAAAYGNIPQAEWHNYEFDHLLPLCAGGSDDIKNLWPQPIDEAHLKDKIEDQVCLGMSAGTMTQAEAVQKIRDFFDQSPGSKGGGKTQ